MSRAELKPLDVATRRAEADIGEMVGTLAADAKRHRAFVARIAKLRAESS